MEFSFFPNNPHFLKEFNAEYLNEKFHYEVFFENECGIGYNITNYNDFYTDRNKIHFSKFLNEIKCLLKEGYNISLYQFWECSKDYNIDENNIYKIKEISTNLQDFMDDYFDFDFNTKYVFVQSLTLSN